MTSLDPLPEPRGYLATAVRLAAAVAPPFFLIQLALTVLWGDRSVSQELPRAAISTAVFAGCWGLFTGTMFVGVMREVPAPEWSRFVSDLNAATSRLGYRPSSVSDHLLEYSPRWRAGFLAGRVSVQRRDDTAVIVGPRTHVGSLVNLLRVAAACASA